MTKIAGSGSGSTVGAQSIACAQSIAPSLIGDNICEKNLNFEKLFLQKIERVIQQHILEQKTTFLALKVEKGMFQKSCFYFL